MRRLMCPLAEPVIIDGEIAALDSGPVFAELNKYDATTHFVGQSRIFTLTADRATGEAYCLAHHVTVDGGKRRLMLASLRYLDTFVKMDGAWLFAERLLYVDWL
ncbi:MAG: nuclear transport factor 2 family protein [Chthoniobacterales bacterium]